MERRNFLKKLFAGTTIIGTAGIFSLKKDIVLANELDLNEVKNFKEEDLIKLANEMFGAMDGQVTHGPIYDFVQKYLKQNSFYENQIGINHNIDYEIEAKISHEKLSKES